MADGQNTRFSERTRKRKENSAKDVHYVYVLYRPDGSPCYVGKGKGNRAESNSRNSHNPIVKRIVSGSGLKSLPFKKIIQDVSESIAFELECFLIKEIGRFSVGGPLVNMTDGGDGVCGHVRTPEQRARMSADKIGKVPNFTEDGMRRIREAAKARGFSDDHKAKISLAKKGKSQGPLSESHRAAIGKSHKGLKRTGAALEAIRAGARNMSDESCRLKSERISVALTGKTLTEKHRASISRVQIGRVRNGEFRDKVSAGLLAFHNNADRDRKIMQMFADGMTAKQIAPHVGLSEDGVDSVKYRQRHPNYYRKN